MDKRIETKVEQLKSSFSVEGVPLIKSDRFSSEEIKEMKSKSNAHSSHWNRQMPSAKIWSNEEIATQIEVFLETPMIGEVKFKKIIENIKKSLPIEDKKKEKKAFRELLFGILNWTEDKNGLSEMWAPFGSAPVSGMSGDKLQEAKTKYGATHMNEIFDNQFSDKFHLFWYGVNNSLQGFDAYWDEEKRKKDLKAKTFTSPYNSLDEIEENVVMKKIPEAAKAFYLDPSKPFEERVKVFSAHGESQSWIFEPSDPDLQKIFQYYSEGEWIERHLEINTVDAVESWMSNLKNNRCKLDWSNPYHPKLKKSERNYKPSKEAIQRLRRFYVEKLFLDGVGSFEFDW